MISAQRIGRWSLVAAFLFTGFGCSSDVRNDGPREVVIAMFGAMEKDDEAMLHRLLDIPELMKNTNSDYALSGDEPRVFHDPEALVKDLTGAGLTKERWFSMQRVIGTAEIMSDAATVNVTFMDKANSKAYLTKFGVHRVNDKWRIYSFQVESE